MSAKKRQAEDAVHAQASKKPKKSNEKKALGAAKVTVSSLLKDEEKAFPRGGGNAITPLERKQTHAKADSDALLDERPRKSAPKSQEKSKNAAKPARRASTDQAPADSSKPAKKHPMFSEDPLKLEDLSAGTVTEGRVTRVEDYAVFVQLRGGDVAGRIGLTDLADDYNKALPRSYRKHQFLKVCVLDVDVPNKKVILSSRTSKTLSSTAPVKDPLLTRASQLKLGQVLRGFVKNVAEMGLFVSLGHNVTAFVRVTDLSDKFLDDWRSKFQIDQLVRGRIVALDAASNRIQMSLKTSVLASDYKPLTSFNDFSVGDIVKGTVRKVEDYGAFIVIDDSQNVSGLCHRSEVAESKVEDVKTLYSEGDRVKAKILSLDAEKRKISFGLKASYFGDEVDSDSGDQESDADEDDSSDDGVDLPLDGLDGLNETLGDESDDESALTGDEPEEPSGSSDDEAAAEGLDAGAFDWTSTSRKEQKARNVSLAEQEAPVSSKKRKSHKGKIVEDRTGDLDANGPQTSSDFERLLLGSPDDAELWIRYMAFQADNAEMSTVRALAERALRSIAITRQSEKLEVWVAWLDIELLYGSAETVDDVFARACAVTNRHEIHDFFADSCIKAARRKEAEADSREEATRLLQRAEETFKAMTKMSECYKRPAFWTKYATFFFNDRHDTSQARALLSRAKQSTSDDNLPQLILGFAQLEFKCDSGDPERGRTMFEELLNTLPKRWDLWDVYLAMEKGQSAWDNVRQLYERLTSQHAPKMKKKRAAKVFGEWMKFEQAHGGEKKINKVKVRRQDYEERLAGQSTTEE